jgi:hypothetical protein
MSVTFFLLLVFALDLKTKRALDLFQFKIGTLSLFLLCLIYQVRPIMMVMPNAKAT